MNLEEAYRPVKKELETVEKRLFELSQSDSEEISDVVFEILHAGGKRLRPALLLAAAKACDYTGDRAVNLAVAVELMHTASLIHDDVIDAADRRRGIATINSRWGNKTAVLVGDHLYSKVVSILAEDGDLNIMKHVAAVACRMTESEMTQNRCRRDVNLTEEKYLSIIAGKTASLMSCSCRVGAMLGSVHDGEIDLLTDYGMNLGMAFQITDDTLDIIGDEEKEGKSLGRDIREGNLTLPLMYALREAGEKDRESIMNAFGSGSTAGHDLTRIMNIIIDYKAIEHSREKAKEYGRTCKEILKGLKKSEIRTSLALLADYVVERAC